MTELLHTIRQVKENLIVLSLLLLYIQCFSMLRYCGSLRKTSTASLKWIHNKINGQTKVHDVIQPFAKIKWSNLRRLFKNRTKGQV